MTAANNILITGAAGFLGPILASKLLENSANRVGLTDLRAPSPPTGFSDNERCICVGADLTVGEEITRLLALNSSWNAIFIIHSIIDAGSSDSRFEATQRRLTQVVYGPPYTTNGTITDDTPATPVGVYGTHKLMMEIFVNDLHRRSLLDAFSVRSPTVTVRPGAPSRSASSCLSGMVRKPMPGQECVMPIDDYSGGCAVCGEEKLALLKVERNVEAERLLKKWPQISDFEDAKRLSLVFDSDCEQIFQEKFGLMFLLGGVFVLKEDVVFFKVHTSVSWAKGVSADETTLGWCLLLRAMLQCLADCLEQCDDLCRGALKLRDAVLPVLVCRPTGSRPVLDRLPNDQTLPPIRNTALSPAWTWPLTPLYLRFTATPINSDAQLETLVR
ncbi:nucleoside-diphosphate-sugar epimerase, putative [Beauveria bassiana ARSEF 2860]|uniref:Nucleoside-diphosphate-sugar epimerase, putative n=1 Tax=Beauveria bassiana (strain ARSEF 2860) TaxID=655819 RepID=J5J7P9_BEAB2|nr:nucleoside-diphosphate-sugar epimerase, putative [Beauveria bassiana ARSEF 2860]EJP62438.1 nucleoside-diphosphate-sugar epimerase, putative [Beauveria bassiana ARSEF 2860]